MKPESSGSSQSIPATAARLHFDPVTLGTWFAIFSAFCYTASIIALRDLAHAQRDSIKDRSRQSAPANSSESTLSQPVSRLSNDIDWAILVACVKSIPVSLMAFAVVTYRAVRGQRVWPSGRIVLKLLLTGLFMQFAGNVAFQLGLTLGGLSLSVPLAYATMMISGAVLGRFILHEQISLRSVAAMLALVLSVAVLSVDAGSVSQSVSGSADVFVVAAAIATACLAGVGWGFPGVVVRRCVTGQLSVSTTVFLLSVTGVLGLGSTSWYRMGAEWMFDVIWAELPTLLLAGVFNALAFFALSMSLKHIPVVRVNILNASQIAMAALAGAVFFGEAMTAWLIAGTGLTASGLILMDRPKLPGQDSGRRS